jgi:hypothetical protein
LFTVGRPTAAAGSAAWTGVAIGASPRWRIQRSVGDRRALLVFPAEAFSGASASECMPALAKVAALESGAGALGVRGWLGTFSRIGAHFRHARSTRFQQSEQHTTRQFGHE